MGFNMSSGGANISGLTWDTDLIVPAARKITADHIENTTALHGIVLNSAPENAAGVGVGSVLGGLIMTFGGGS